MGVSSTTNRQAPYIGDGSSTVFPYPFYFFTPADLAVYLYDTGSSVVFPQALNTNYTVSGNVNSQGVFPSGGSVVMNSAFPSNLQLIITRSPAQKQNYVLNQNGQINSLALVQQFDYLTTLVQRLQDEVSRAVQLPDGLGILNNTQFNQVLPQGILLPSLGGAPLVLNSGATGWAFGTVATNASGAVSYLGILPVVNGGTGQGSALVPGSLWYSLTATQMAQIPQGAPGSALQSNGSSAPSWGAVTVGSGIIGYGNGGTGNGFGFPQNTIIFSSGAAQFQSLPGFATGFPLVSQGSSAPVFGGIALNNSSVVTGTLPINQGGTGVPVLAPQFGLIYASSATQLAVIPAGGIGQVLTGTGSSVPTFQSVPSPLLSVVSKTATYQMTNADDVVLVSSSGFTVGLPDATSATLKLFRIKKTDATVANVTLAASGAQLIGSFNTVNLSTQEECWELIPNGVGFNIINHLTKTVPATYVPAISDALGSSSVQSKFFWQRDGNQTKIWGTTVTGVPQAHLFSFGLPSGIIVDSSIVFPINTIASSGMKIGTFVTNGASQFFNVVLAPATSTGLVYGGSQLSGVSPLVPATTSPAITANNLVSFEMSVPTVGFFQ